MKITYDQHKYLPKVPDAALWIRRIVLAWLVAAAAEYLLLPGELRSLSSLDGIGRMSAGRMAVIAAGVFALSILLGRFLLERWLIFAVAVVLLGTAVASSFTWPFLIVSALVMAVLFFYGLCGWNGKGLARGPRYKEKKLYAWLAAFAAVTFFGVVSAWTVARVYSFSVPTFDFGIFSQMFHSMKTTGLPITTVERDGPLSHFAVHVSPIYYLMLPFYCMLPHPATLQVLQAAVLASAVIPLWKLGKHHGMKPLPRLLLCCVLLVYPAYAGGTSYDIHENCFLTPLLLWLFYGIDRRNIPVTTAAALLTLMVKEDAAVYVAVAGLYLMLRSLLSRDKKWGLVAGFALVAAAVAWFLAVTGYLAQRGDGVMTYRYKNFMYDGSGSLVTVIKAVLLCPAKAVFECVDPEKLEFIALTLLPLGLLPLLTRRYERYVLLIPYLLVNLMSDYQYQHDIFFQYTFGSTACLVYLALVNLADIHLERTRLIALGLALAVGIGCFCAQIMPKVIRYTGYMDTYEDYYGKIRDMLDTVPEDASVAATTYYTTYLSQRDTLYDVRYSSREHLLSCEYIVVGVTDTSGLKTFKTAEKSGYENLRDLLLAEGYRVVTAYEGKLEIYRK